MISYFYILMIFSVTLPSCISTSNLQSSRPLKAKTWAFKTALGIQSIKNLNTDDEDLDRALEKLPIPLFEVGARYGLTDKSELTLKYNSPFTGTLESRYNLINEEKYALATGASLGYGRFSVESNFEDQTWHIMEAKLGLFASYELDEDIALHTSLAVMNRLNWVKAKTQFADSQRELRSYISTTLAGSYKILFIEAGINKSINRSEYFYSLLLGVVYPIRNLMRPSQDKA